MASFEEAPPGNKATGEKIFKTKCAQCHTVDKGAGHKQGMKELKLILYWSVFECLDRICCSYFLVLISFPVLFLYFVCLVVDFFWLTLSRSCIELKRSSALS